MTGRMIMRHRYGLWLIVGSLLLCGCRPAPKAALYIGEVPVSVEEFETAFQQSGYASMGDAGRAVFLESYINTRLILKEAERIGLDRRPETLREIQGLWEQTLLKEMITRKTSEFAMAARVTDEQVREYFEAHRQEFKGRDLERCREELHWMLLKIKQNTGVSSWIRELRAKNEIKVNTSALGIGP